MSSLPTDGYRLTNISPKSYEHPADKAATAALKKLPYVDTAIRKLLSLGYEKAYTEGHLTQGLRMNERQLAEVHTLHYACYVTLDRPTPPVYLVSMPFPNAYAFGVQNPAVALHSSLLELLEGDGEALRSVFAHEAGHIISDHMLYRTVLIIMIQLGDALPLPLWPVKYALLEWFRASELTCDRVAALVTRDPMAICRTMMVLSAGIRGERLNLDEFMVQGQEYDESPRGFQRLQRMLSQLNATHPLPVKRISALMDWVRSGDYDRIVGGDYIRRDEEPPVRESATEAREHYTGKFDGAFKDLQTGFGEMNEQAREASTKVSEASTKVSDWLNKQAAKRNGGGEEEDV